MPEWAQQLTGTHQPPLLQRVWVQPADRLKAAMVRWAISELPCKRTATERATGTAARRLAPVAA